MSMGLLLVGTFISVLITTFGTVSLTSLIGHWLPALGIQYPCCHFDIGHKAVNIRIPATDYMPVQIMPKETSDMSKVKTSAPKTKCTKAQVTHHGSDTDATTTSGPTYALPPLDRFREEARTQAEVQNRLRQLADNAKPGTEKN